MKIKSAVESLSALGHAGRLSAFRMLVKAGPDGLAAGEIAHRLDVPPNSLSTNLSILSRAGLVESRRDGRSIIYAASFSQMSGLLEFLMEDCCNSAPEICIPLVGLLTRSSRCVSKATRVRT